MTDPDTPVDWTKPAVPSVGVLAAALDQHWCVHCDGPVLYPVRDPRAVAWLGVAGVEVFCSQECLEAHGQARAHAAGGPS